MNDYRLNSIIKHLNYDVDYQAKIKTNLKCQYLLRFNDEFKYPICEKLRQFRFIFGCISHEIKKLHYRKNT